MNGKHETCEINHDKESLLYDREEDHGKGAVPNMWSGLGKKKTLPKRDGLWETELS